MHQQGIREKKNKGGKRMNSAAWVWDISPVENSDIIQLFITLNCLCGWPEHIILAWHYGSIPLTKEYTSFLSVSPLGKELHSSSLRTHLYSSEHLCFLFIPLPSAQKKNLSLLKHLDCILLWYINLHILNIYFKKKKVAKTTKNKSVGRGNRRLWKVISLFLLRVLVQSLSV